jgi:hypothetical protein
MHQPTPTHLKITQAPVPMRINFTAQVVRFNLSAAGDQIKSGRRQNKAQPRKGVGIPDLTGFELETRRFIVQKEFLNVEPQTKFIQSVQVSRFVADDRPLFKALWGLHMRQSQMHRAEPMFS